MTQAKRYIREIFSGGIEKEGVFFSCVRAVYCVAADGQFFELWIYVADIWHGIFAGGIVDVLRNKSIANGPRDIGRNCFLGIFYGVLSVIFWSGMFLNRRMHGSVRTIMRLLEDGG